MSLSQPVWEKSSSRIQGILLIAFVAINCFLFVFAVDVRPYPGGPLLSPTYHGAADGQRYWGVAINLASKGTFTIPSLWDSRPEIPLTRSGPLPAIIFSIPIKIFHLRNLFWLVIRQIISS